MLWLPGRHVARLPPRPQQARFGAPGAAPVRDSIPRPHTAGTFPHPQPGRRVARLPSRLRRPPATAFLGRAPACLPPRPGRDAQATPKHRLPAPRPQKKRAGRLCSRPARSPLSAAHRAAGPAGGENHEPSPAAPCATPKVPKRETPRPSRAPGTRRPGTRRPEASGGLRPRPAPGRAHGRASSPCPGSGPAAASSTRWRNGRRSCCPKRRGSRSGCSSCQGRAGPRRWSRR